MFILFSPLTAFSRISWSSLQKSPSSLSANSSPGTNCLSHATHRKHCWWYILLRALITKSFLLKHCPHLLHFVPNSLQKNIITVNIHHPYQNGNHPSQHVVTTITTKLTLYGVMRKIAKIITIALTVMLSSSSFVENKNTATKKSSFSFFPHACASKHLKFLPYIFNNQARVIILKIVTETRGLFILCKIATLTSHNLPYNMFFHPLQSMCKSHPETDDIQHI